jgi:hypothetical protein
LVGEVASAPVSRVLSSFGTAQSDRDLICVDHGALDMLADELMVPDVNVGSSCLRIGSPRLFYCLADEGLDNWR